MDSILLYQRMKSLVYEKTQKKIPKASLRYTNICFYILNDYLPIFISLLFSTFFILHIAYKQLDNGDYSIEHQEKNGIISIKL